MKKEIVLTLTFLSVFFLTAYSQFDVSWTAISTSSTLSVTGNTLTKIDTRNSWTAGASSFNTIPANTDGWVSTTIAETDTRRSIGLSATNGGRNHKTAEFSFYINNNGKFNIFESGTNRGNFGFYTTGMVLRIERRGTTISYWKDGALIYTSEIPSTSSLLIDVALQTSGATISDVQSSICALPKTVGTACNDFTGVIQADGCTCLDNSSAGGFFEDAGNNDISYAGGKVFIGTTTAVEDYELIVQGRVLFEEVMVLEAGLWPDYVFEDTYDLKSIEAVEAYIQANKHLPGIPSAKEIDGKGVQLGDMQRLTMEKIEEMMLYHIASNNKIKTLEAKNAELEDLIRALTEKVEALSTAEK